VRQREANLADALVVHHQQCIAEMHLRNKLIVNTRWLGGAASIVLGPNPSSGLKELNAMQ
jgi:hypothetical protein